MARRQKLTVLSLYTGAGGLDLGFEAAGFATRAAVEMDRACVQSLRANRAWPVLDRSIHDITSEEVLRTADLKVGDADILIGGPPCQPFSKAGYWASGDAKRLDDPRSDTVAAYLRVLRDTQPRAFLMENVAGLAYKGKDEGLHLIRKTLDSINRATGTRYQAELLVLNAADYGIPQVRERAFLIGSRDGNSIGHVLPTHRSPATLGQTLPLHGDLPLYRTAWDALGDLSDDNDPELELRGKWADLLPSIPEGRNYLHHTARGAGAPLFGWRRRYWNFLLKLAKTSPSWTLTAQPGPATGPFHWKNRRLSSRELSRLQTIPDDYTVIGDLSAVQRQIGNAVPSALAEMLALVIRQKLFNEPQVDISPTLLPPRRAGTPPPEAVAKTPKKYLHLAGTHAAHPGTGKGNRAMARDLSA